MFQTSDNSKLCIDSQYSSQQFTFVWSLKHQISQPIYILNKVRVFHLDRLKEGTWLHTLVPWLICLLICVSDPSKELWLSTRIPPVILVFNLKMEKLQPLWWIRQPPKMVSWLSTTCLNSMVSFLGFLFKVNHFELSETSVDSN